jgi:hypothetical protein
VERFWRDMKDKVAFNNFKDEQELEEANPIPASAKIEINP